MNISKLTGGTDTTTQTRNEPVSSEKNSTAAKAQETAAAGDQVKLSSSSKSIQQIEAEIRDMPEVDDATVERIRSQIESGEYKIDYDKLAGKMLSFEDNLN
ncbi:MAG: flagellar biosynthesis anti-sigma factor FlgM [Pseudomonadota bacterium]|nr:flagellar biosynthesis anti-sigma factor FlgM [Pseudomonadota bacterium]